ncbi:MAG: hypothetical protein K8F31_07475 [Roseovarius sp.]|nr:hypothetical protein [Roseovarius sp.]
MKERSPEVHEFLTLFRSVKEQCGDEPARIEWLIENKDRFRALCNKLHYSASLLKSHERRRRELYIENVAVDFREAWRDFEERFEDSVNPLARLLDVDLGLPDSHPTTEENSIPKSKIEDYWDLLDDEAAAFAVGFSDALSEQEDRLENRRELDGSASTEDFLMQEGLDGWRELEKAGVDIRGIFRRRKLCPVFLLPPETNDINYADGSYRKLLTATQNAFVYGVFPACSALLRTNLEAILQDIYGAKGDGLKNKIISVKEVLSDELFRRVLLIKTTADDILHGNKAAKSNYTNDPQLEIRLLQGMETVRELLEKNHTKVKVC